MEPVIVHVLKAELVSAQGKLAGIDRAITDAQKELERVLDRKRQLLEIERQIVAHLEANGVDLSIAAPAAGGKE